MIDRNRRRRKFKAGLDTAKVLEWYDAHRRDLPWRAKPAEKPDPYRVWLSEIMLQQTTVAAVKPYFARFVALWPDIAALAAAPSDAIMREWAGLGYYARARNLHACAKIVAARPATNFPDTEAELRELPGIGAYTAAAVAAIAFGRRAAVADGNIERLTARLLAITTPLPKAKARIRAAVDSATPADRPGDFAQALMDIGATICAPRNPLCASCPLHGGCAAARAGRPADFPVKALRRPRPGRFGAAYVIVRGETILARRRPEQGLLGGMAEVPGSAWSEHAAPGATPAPFKARWAAAAPVRHVFTHFSLELAVFAARAPRNFAAPDKHYWLPCADIPSGGFSSLMRKVLAAGLAILKT